ncbi:Acyl-CoA thioesterase FadM [Marinospirillum celere]|uniref:Acyl-CoA thioesterase FadM n=1 Tax=Marinospirillum celere TaxID=1122252 RepID=A0A1I1FQM6_9GAMM|nr:acyl-CoA thioesterase [Marinospirillum celere]SFB99290.1 Acyl-CoA thioesterase FadM [Marinospirillum celere]
MARVQLEFPADPVFSHRQALRISDINYGQHLGHDTLVSFLHEARCSWLASAEITELSIDGGTVGWVVADMIVNYRKEAFYPDQLTIDLALGELGRKGVEVLHRVTRSDGELVAMAKTGMVFFDYVSHQAVPVPENFLRLSGRI